MDLRTLGKVRGGSGTRGATRAAYETPCEGCVGRGKRNM